MFAKVSSIAALALLAVSGATAQSVASFTYGTANPTAAGVVATSTNGPTNPDTPSLGTAINQTSEARLLSVNSVDDWCTFSSPDGLSIADEEAIVVAYCTKARNNARVIPDGTLTAVHFIKTPLYVQVMALGDFTKIGIQAGDYGGELDPHGATGEGNPVGGNVTSNVSGTDVFYEEWMNYVAYNIMCIRICIAGSAQAPTKTVCQHTLDEMGCEFVMPGDYSDNVFESCDADAAYPPGLYPVGSGSTSTFQQYYSSVYTDSNGGRHTFVNASPDQETPTAAYSIPSQSNCVTTSTIANNIASLVSGSSSASSTGSSSASSSTASTASTRSTTSSSSASQSSSGSGASTSSTASGASSLVPGAFAAGVAAIFTGLFATVAML